MRMLRCLFHRMPRDCARVGKVLQQYLDSELDVATATEVLSHLEECRDCGLEAETYRRIKASVARSGIPDPDSLQKLRAFAEELATSGEQPEPADGD